MASSHSLVAGRVARRRARPARGARVTVDERPPEQRVDDVRRRGRRPSACARRPTAWRCCVSADNDALPGAPKVNAARNARAYGTSAGSMPMTAEEGAASRVRPREHDAGDEAEDDPRLRVAHAQVPSPVADGVRDAHLHAAHQAEDDHVAEEHDRHRDAHASERRRAQAPDELRVDEAHRGLAGHRRRDGPGERDELAHRDRERRAPDHRPLAPRVVPRSAWATRRFNRPRQLIFISSPGAPASPGDSGLPRGECRPANYVLDTLTNAGFAKPRFASAIRASVGRSIVAITADKVTRNVGRVKSACGCVSRVCRVRRPRRHRPRRAGGPAGCDAVALCDPSGCARGRRRRCERLVQERLGAQKRGV